MQISRRSRITKAFVLTWDDVQKIYTELGIDLPKISLNATGADGLTRSFENLNELQNFRNAKKNEIKELEFSARDNNFEQRCSISFNTLRRANINFTIDASEATATRLNSFFEDLVDSMSPWYAIVARINWENLLLGLMAMILSISLLVALAMGAFTKIGWSSFTDGLKPGGVIIGFIPWVFAMALNKIRDTFFPMGVFSIGDGVRRHNQLETIRTVVVAGFFISITSSFVMLIF